MPKNATPRTESAGQSDLSLPRALAKPIGKVGALEAQRAERLVASKRTGEAVSRESLAALYALAARLHSTQLPFHAKRIETSKDKHVTTEQIWMQMNGLLRPVLRRLQDSVHKAERTFGGASDKAGTSHGSRMLSKRATAAEEEEEDDNVDNSETGSSGSGEGMKDHDERASNHTSDLSESDLDEEISALLKARAARQKKPSSSSAGGEGGEKNGKAKGGDAWRYAFGSGNAEEEDEDDWGETRERAADEEGGEEGDSGDDEVDDEAGSGHRHNRVRDRNARALLDADEEEDEEGGAAEEELQALKELYGEDFEDDGTGFIGDEEDPELEKDLFFDDPSGPGADAEDPDALYDEQRDGQYWGKADMLNDPAGDFEDDPTGVGAMSAADGAVGDDDGNTAAGDDEDAAFDAELEAALQDPTLTELEKERLREKKLIERLEQKRLYNTDWAMTGETAASKRPREALLEVDDLEFEYGMKSVPVITEAFTAKLEDRIKKRILDKNFDDVQRRTMLSTADDLATTKRDAALDSEKSKLSLMDLYEKEYMEKMRLAEEAAGESAPSAEPLTEIEKDELRAIQMWKRLAQHLDALSNFYYTPKPVQQDLEARVRAVDQQAPAIVMETVGNFATTRENALAPQDLYRGSSRKFADVGADELNPQERRALRRSKKDEGKKSKEHKEAHTAKVKEQKKQVAALAK